MSATVYSDSASLLEKRIQHHADRIAELSAELRRLKEHANEIEEPANVVTAPAPCSTGSKYPLLPEEYRRYGRQLIMPEIGLQGQLRIKHASVLIAGGGGLGCPAAAYLAGAGVGRLGVVDGDLVEDSNLHRQILHGSKVGMNKAESIALSLNELNPLTACYAHKEHLTPANASSIISSYDLILDCTDNPASRYLISDACVLLSKPLLSASALRTEGQLTLLNHPARPAGDASGGPCYRCIFPKPPPADSVTSCGEGGILGPVVGVMGVLQALEAVKLLAGGNCSISNLSSVESVVNADHKSKAKHQPAPQSVSQSSAPAPSMLLFSAYQDTSPFRSIRLRRRNPKCAVCSGMATVSLATLDSGSLDYVQFCNSNASKPDASAAAAGVDIANAIAAPSRVDAPAYAQVLASHQPHVLIDTREQVQFELCALPGSINLPFSEAACSGYETDAQLQAFRDKFQSILVDAAATIATDDGAQRTEQADEILSIPVYVVCRLGNDSQVLVRRLKQLGLDDGGKRHIADITGGLRAWTREVDNEFPEY